MLLDNKEKPISDGIGGGLTAKEGTTGIEMFPILIGVLGT